ncbi:MAG TPA: hypothetical protein VND19_14265 [Acetobacteraceae bacterium]|nr:hypothetical protein [Acetobacteraceae bacterium]
MAIRTAAACGARRKRPDHALAAPVAALVNTGRLPHDRLCVPRRALHKAAPIGRLGLQRRLM